MTDRAGLALRISAQPARLAGVRREVRAFLSAQGVTVEDTEAVVLALDEACTNIIRHAYGGACGNPIVIDLEVGPEGITVLLSDEAPPLNAGVFQPRAPDPARPGRLGLHFIHELMDRVELLPAEGASGNRLHLWRRRRRDTTSS